MDGAVVVLAVRIDATPYREALAEMGGLVRSSRRARMIWDELDARRALGQCDLAEQAHVDGAAVTRPSAEFLSALAQMRAVVAEEAVK